MFYRDVRLIRLLLLGLFVFFVAGFVASEYSLVRDAVRFICISCLGLGG
jgi:hypothetical protein